MQVPSIQSRPAVIDLFCGAGGFTLGAHLAGFETILAIDVDHDLTASFGTNFPNVELQHKDIATYDAVAALSAVGRKPGEIACIVGGPPCQGFSTIGQRDPKDPRNDLVARFFEFVRKADPAFFIMENVPNLLSDKFRPKLDSGIDLVSSDYEIVGPLVVDAGDFGAATRRPRVMVIGFRSERVDSFDENDIRALENGGPASVREAIGDLASPTTNNTDDAGHSWASYGRDPVDDGGEYARTAREMPPEGLSNEVVRSNLTEGMVSGFPPTEHTEAVLERWRKLEPGGVDSVSKARRLHWEEACTTLRAGTGRDRGAFQSVRPIHPDEHRVITIREAARIQGFPDWFQFHKTKWHSFRMIGNSVSPLLSKALLSFLQSRIS